MEFEEYREYLRGEDWRESRKMLMEESGWMCDVCGDKAVQLHHLIYDNLGAEELDVDVVALCNECHKEIHNKEEWGDDYGDYGI